MKNLDSTKHYAGRVKYQRYRTAIHILVALFRLLPVRVCLFLWALSDLSYGHFGSLIRYCVLKKLARRCGDRVFVGRGCTIRYWENLEIGDRVSIQEHCHIEARGGVIIGNDVSIGHFTSVVSTNHGWADEQRPIRDNPVSSKSVRICDDVWVGSGCHLLSGVTVFSRAIVAACAVVTRDVPAGTIVGGVPARPIKNIGIGERT